MTTPTPRSRIAIIADTGPSRSVLQQLLEEINGTEPETRHTSKPPSRTSSVRSFNRKESVWVRGNIVAEDAREKLRAADQARQRRKLNDGCNNPSPEQPPLLRRRSTQLGMLHVPSQPTGLIRKAPTFNEASPASETIPCFRDGASVSPATSDSSSSLGKSQCSSPYSKGPSPKRPRISTLPAHHLRTQGSKDSEPDSIAALSRNTNFTERDCSRDDLNSGPASLCEGPTISSFRPIAATPQGHSEFTTPMRNSQQPIPSPFLASSRAPTPTWMKPFHLVDDGTSIFKNVHGEDSNEYPLCLHCFRGQGSFHRILQEGCEVCGREEVLKGHYWEQMIDTY